MTMIGKIKEAGILTVFRGARGSRAPILAFSELLNLCEGHDVIPLKSATPTAVKQKKIQTQESWYDR